jgi:hypothetical protein
MKSTKVYLGSDFKMERVTKSNPCPICGKPNWCLVAPDGSAAICQRISEGSIRRCNNDAGWLHLIGDRNSARNRHPSNAHRERVALTYVETTSREHFGKLSETFQQGLNAERLANLAESLNLSIKSLERLRVGWDSIAYTFPMSNASGLIVGIRRRMPDGHKVAVKGSNTGIFIPIDVSSKDILLICEGPTDTAAALDLGYSAIGRPNCNSGNALISQYARGRDTVVVGDNDVAGKNGAKKLSNLLALHCPCVKVVYPPPGIKDLRQWLKAGLKREELQQGIDLAKKIQVIISFRG